METEYQEKPTGSFKSPGFGGIGTTQTNCVKITVFFDDGERMLVRVRDSRQPDNTFGKYKVIGRDKYKPS